MNSIGYCTCGGCVRGEPCLNPQSAITPADALDRIMSALPAEQQDRIGLQLVAWMKSASRTDEYVEAELRKFVEHLKTQL